MHPNQIDNLGPLAPDTCLRVAGCSFPDTVNRELGFPLNGRNAPEKGAWWRLASIVLYFFSPFVLSFIPSSGL